MTYTVRLDFFIDEDVVRTDEQVKEVVKDIFDHCNCSASDIKVIKADDKEALEKWVKDNYKQYATGWTWERSEGNCYDCFDDGFTSATSWAAYDVGCILGMELEEPDWDDDCEV